MHVVDAREGELVANILSKRKLERHIPCGPISTGERTGVGEVGGSEHCLIVIRRGILQSEGRGCESVTFRILGSHYFSVACGTIFQKLTASFTILLIDLLF